MPFSHIPSQSSNDVSQGRRLLKLLRKNFSARFKVRLSLGIDGTFKLRDIFRHGPDALIHMRFRILRFHVPVQLLSLEGLLLRSGFKP